MQQTTWGELIHSDVPLWPMVLYRAGQNIYCHMPRANRLQAYWSHRLFCPEWTEAFSPGIFFLEQYLEIDLYGGSHAVEHTYGRFNPWVAKVILTFVFRIYTRLTLSSILIGFPDATALSLLPARRQRELINVQNGPVATVTSINRLHCPVL